jgi:hypothetical protein
MINSVPDKLILNANLSAVFCRDVYLQKLIRKLVKNNVKTFRDLVHLTENEILEIAPTTAHTNIQRLKIRLSEMQLSLK